MKYVYKSYSLIFTSDLIGKIKYIIQKFRIFLNLNLFFCKGKKSIKNKIFQCWMIDIINFFKCIEIKLIN